MAGFEDVLKDLASANKAAAARGPTKFQRQVALDQEREYGLGETFGRGAQAGAQGLRADLNYFAALGNSLIGDEQGVSKRVQRARVNESLAADTLGNLQSFGDFWEEPTFGGFISQVAKGTGQLTPFAITSIASAGVGALGSVGLKVAGEGTKYAAKKILKESLEKTAKDIATPDEKEIAENAYNLAKRARYGAYTGAGASEFAPLSGSNFAEAIESGEDPNDPLVAFRAAALGVPQAAIGVGGEVALVKLIAGRAKKLSGGNRASTMGRLAEDFGKGFLRGGAIEGTTEFAQEGLAVLNRAEMDDTFTAQDAKLRLGEAAFAAFFGGGAFGAAGSTVSGGVREVRDAPIPEGVAQKARELVEQGKQTFTDTVVNNEFLSKARAGFSTQEPTSAINAQLRAMQDPNNQKGAVWVEGSSPKFNATETPSAKRINGQVAFAAFIPGRGTIVSPEEDVVQGVINGNASEEVLQAALGYSNTKPPDADRVVQVTDTDGNVIYEEATNEDGEAAARVNATTQMPPGGSVSTKAIDDVLVEREAKTRAETPPQAEDAQGVSYLGNVLNTLDNQQGPIVRDMRTGGTIDTGAMPVSYENRLPETGNQEVDRVVSEIEAMTPESPRQTTFRRQDVTGRSPSPDTRQEAIRATERETIGTRLDSLAKENPDNANLQELNRRYQEADTSGKENILQALLLEKEALDRSLRDPRREVEIGEDITDDVEGLVADPTSPISEIPERNVTQTSEKFYGPMQLTSAGAINEAIYNRPKSKREGQDLDTARAEFQEAYEGVIESDFTDNGFWQRMSPATLRFLTAQRRANRDVEINIAEDGRYRIQVFSSAAELFRHQPRKPVTREDGKKVTADEQLLTLEEFLEAEVKQATDSKFASGSSAQITLPDGTAKTVNLVDLVNAGRRILETRLQQDFTTATDGEAFLEIVKELLNNNYKLAIKAKGTRQGVENPFIDITQTGPDGRNILTEIARYQLQLNRWFVDNSDPDPADATKRKLRDGASRLKPPLPAYLEPAAAAVVGKTISGKNVTLSSILGKNLKMTRSQEDIDAANERSEAALAERAQRDSGGDVEVQRLREEGIIDRERTGIPGGDEEVGGRLVQEGLDTGVPYNYYGIDNPRTSGEVWTEADRRAWFGNEVTFPFGETPRLVQSVLSVAVKALRLTRPTAVIAISQLNALTQGQITERFGDPQVAQHLINSARQLRDDNLNLGKSITYNNAHFVLVDDTATSNDYETTMVAAHEIGHAFLNEAKAGWISGPHYKRMQRAFAREAAKPDAPEQYQGDLGFEEWFADNVAKWTIGEYRNSKAKNVVESEFKKIAARLKQMFAAVRASLKRRFGGEVDVSVEQFIEQVVGSMKNQTAMVSRGALQDAVYANDGQKLLIRNLIEEVQSTAGARKFAQDLFKQAQSTIREAVKGMEPLRRVFFTANKNLRMLGETDADGSTTVGDLIANMFYIEAGATGALATRGGGDMGFLQQADVANREIEERFRREIGELDSPEVIDAMEIANSDTATDAIENELAKKIRNFLSDLHKTYVSPVQANYKFGESKIGFMENYFPVVLNLQEIANDPDRFKGLLYEAEMRRKPNATAAQQIEARETIEKAVNRIVKYQDVVQNSDLTVDEDIEPGQGREEARRLTALLDRDQLRRSGFSLPPIEAFMIYKKQLVKRVEWNRATKDNRGKDLLRPLLNQLSDQEKAYASEIINTYLGYGFEPMSEERRKWQSRLLAAQYTLLLPFAAIGSLPELAGPIIFSKEFNGFEMAFRQIKQGLSQKEARQMAEDIGLVQDGAVSNAWMSVTEREHLDEASRNWTDKFFRLTGLEFFTNFSRSFATGMAVQFLLRHAVNDTNNPRAPRYLEALGVTPQEILAWDQGGRVFTDQNGRRVKAAIQQFVESSILRPNAAERPVWASDPRWALVWQLKSYFYAFYTKIIGGIRRETMTRLGEGEGAGRIYGSAGVLALAAASLFPLAMAGMELREYAKTGLAFFTTFGESDKNYFRTDNMEWGAYLGEVLDKSGIYGPMSIVSMAYRTGQWNGPAAGVATLLGPTFETVEGLFSRGDVSRLVPAAAIL